VLVRLPGGDDANRAAVSWATTDEDIDRSAAVIAAAVNAQPSVYIGNRSRHWLDLQAPANALNGNAFSAARRAVESRHGYA
jgi:hypothetical protein